jgi:hypothetical protein
LPRRSVFEADEHGLLIGRVPDLEREALVYSANSGMRVDRGPDSFAGLLVLREHVPVGGDPGVGCDRRPVQG